MIRSSLGEFLFNSDEHVISMFIYTTPEDLIVMTGFLSSHGMDDEAGHSIRDLIGKSITIIDRSHNYFTLWHAQLLIKRKALRVYKLWNQYLF